MRQNRIALTAALALLLAAACASTSSTGEPGLFRIEVAREPAGVRATVRNDASAPLEILAVAVRPVEGETGTFEPLATNGPRRLAPGETIVSSFALSAGAALPGRVVVEVTFRRGEGSMERRSYWADLP